MTDGTSTVRRMKASMKTALARPRPMQLDDAVVAEHESAEHRDHDDRRRRDDAAGFPLTDRDRARGCRGCAPTPRASG